MSYINNNNIQYLTKVSTPLTFRQSISYIFSRDNTIENETWIYFRVVNVQPGIAVKIYCPLKITQIQPLLSKKMATKLSTP